MKITSNIFQVGGSTESHPADAAIYLIKSGNKAALIDSGTGKGTKDVLNNIAKSGVDHKDIQYLFLTHCHYDHTGGANQIKELTNCKIVAHHLDAEFLEFGNSHVTAARWYGTFMEPTGIDIKVEDDTKVFKIDDLEIFFHHTPGHSPGSSVLSVISDELNVLFGQDVHGPLNEVLRSDTSDYKKSLEFMLSLNADILCEGHFGVFKGKDKVKNFIESFL